MKKLLYSAIIGISLVVNCYSQLPPATPPLPGGEIITLGDVAPPGASSFINFLLSSSNLMVAPYGMVSTDFKHFGGGIALAYRVSDFVVTMLRLDEWDSTIFMPSASLQLQVPIQLFGTNGVTFIPFAFGGVATVLGHIGGSSSTTSSDVVAISGLGAAIQLGKHWDIVGDVERWSNTPSTQIRFGVLYKF